MIFQPIMLASYSKDDAPQDQEETKKSQNEMDSQIKLIAFHDSFLCLFISYFCFIIVH